MTVQEIQVQHICGTIGVCACSELELECACVFDDHGRCTQCGAAMFPIDCDTGLRLDRAALA